jgi:hypothetical protein
MAGEEQQPETGLGEPERRNGSVRRRLGVRRRLAQLVIVIGMGAAFFFPEAYLSGNAVIQVVACGLGIALGFLAYAGLEARWDNRGERKAKRSET